MARLQRKTDSRANDRKPTQAAYYHIINMAFIISSSLIASAAGKVVIDDATGITLRAMHKSITCGLYCLHPIYATAVNARSVNPRTL